MFASQPIVFHTDLMCGVCGLKRQSNQTLQFERKISGMNGTVALVNARKLILSDTILVARIASLRMVLMKKAVLSTK